MGRRGFVQYGHFSDKREWGSSDAVVRTFWRKIGFFEIYDASARTKGLGQCRYFADKRSAFRDFVWTFFMYDSFLVLKTRNTKLKKLPTAHK